MIHPHTELRNLGEPIGYGVFATAFIPEGTIVYVKDSLETVISPTDYLLHPPDMRAVVDKYSYIDPEGNRVVSWDFAKYVNHCCDCNTISTGYGFEMAVRDIQAGEQITDEYGIFNMDEEMVLHCGKPNCRQTIRPEDFDRYYGDWDLRIRASIHRLFMVDQPLMGFVDADTRAALDTLYQDPEQYRSVYALRLQKSQQNPKQNT